jgi:hypothetical protein
MEKDIKAMLGLVHHGKNEFARGNAHINGIESFWGYAKIRLVKFKLALPLIMLCSLAAEQSDTISV